MSDGTPSSHPSTTAQLPAAHTASQPNSLIYDLLTQGTNHGAAAQQHRYRSVFLSLVGVIFFHVCYSACVCVEQNYRFHASIGKRLMPLQVSRVLSSGLNNDLLQRVWLCGAKVQNANTCIDFDYSKFGNFPNWPTNFK